MIKQEKNPLIFVFLSYWKDFVGKKEFESSTVNELSGFEPLRFYICEALLMSTLTYVFVQKYENYIYGNSSYLEL